MDKLQRAKMISRLSYYKVDCNKLSDKDMSEINTLIIAYVTKGEKQAKKIFKELLLKLTSLRLVINYSLLEAVRVFGQSNSKPASDYAVTKKKTEIKNTFVVPSVKKKHKHVSETKGQALAKSFLERKSDLGIKPVARIKPLNECKCCGEIAITQTELEYFFNKRIDGSFKTICKGCE